MKRKFSQQIQPNKPIESHVQQITDDLSEVLNRGLSFDINLPSRIFRVNVPHNQQVAMPILGGFTCAGAIPMFVEGVGVSISNITYAYDRQNILNLTLQFSDSLSHNVTFFCIYE